MSGRITFFSRSVERGIAPISIVAFSYSQAVNSSLFHLVQRPLIGLLITAAERKPGGSSVLVLI